MALVLPDERLTYPELLHPGRKPTIPVEVGTGFKRGFEFLLLNDEIDQSGNYSITNQGVAAPNGLGWEFTGTDRFELPSGIGTAVQNEHTFMFVWWDDGSSWTSGHLFDNRTGTENGIDIGTISGLSYAVDPGSDQTINISDSLIKAGKNVLVCVRASDEIFCHLNGNLAGSLSIGVNPSTATATNKIGNQANNGDPLGSTRRLEAAAIWSVSIPRVLAQSLSLNPYQFLIPR